MDINKIYCGNSLDLINDLNVSPKLIIMSPPDIAETAFALQEYQQFLNEIYNLCIDKLDEHGVLVSITTDRKMDGEIYLKHIDIINSIKSKSMLFNYKIWCKSRGINIYILNYCHLLCFRKSKKITNNKIKEWYKDVFIIERDKIKGYKTKDSFPSKLIEIIIKNFTNENDLVFDPFVGSGKTAKVAKNLKRNYIGFELEKKNVDIANELLREFQV